MALNVHFNHIYNAEFTEELQRYLDKNIHISMGKDIPKPAVYEVLIHPSPTKEWIESSSNLRAIVIPWAGIDEDVRNLMRNYPEISLHNLHHNNFNTAEMGFALLLTAAKNIIPLDQALRKNDWTPRYQKTQAILLRDKTALILGFGEIGQALAAYCLGLGMKVKAIRKHPNHEPVEKGVEIFPNEDLHKLLPYADVVLIALPLTNETENLIDHKELQLMPKGAILVNIGRGPIVNQYALFDALKTGHLRAAASDVWYNYPKTQAERSNTPPADVPFGELDNFVLSPHRGGMVEEVEIQRAQALAALLNAANRHQPIPNKIDLEAGY